MFRLRTKFIIIRILESRLISSIKPSIEPEVTVHPRLKGKPDLFCEKIKEIGAAIDWNDFRSKYNPTKNPVRKLDRNFESRVIYCLLVKFSDREPDIHHLRKSFLSYLQSSSRSDSSPGHLVHELGLCALMGKVDAEGYAGEISRIVTKIINSGGVATRFPIFRGVIEGLSKSSKENCLMAIKLTSEHRLTFTSIAVLVENCMYHGLFNEAIDLIPKLEKIDMEQYISYFINKDFDETTWINLMKICQTKNIGISEVSSNHIDNIFNKFGYNSDVSKPDTNGTCSFCGAHLQRLVQDECDSLRKSIFDHVLTGSDLFHNTNPVELRKFTKMIDQRLEKGHYHDLVIDGLNAFYAVNSTIWIPKSKHVDRKFTSMKNSNIQYESFKRAFDVRLIHGKSILVIGRSHMLRTPGMGEFLRSNHKEVTFYAVGDDSKDDAFILYAGVRSPNTYVVSNDLYRDHLAILNDPALFNRWHKGRTILLNDFINRVPLPPSYDVCVNVSKDFDTIHVPYEGAKSITWKCYQKLGK